MQDLIFGSFGFFVIELSLNITKVASKDFFNLTQSRYLLVKLIDVTPTKQYIKEEKEVVFFNQKIYSISW